MSSTSLYGSTLRRRWRILRLLTVLCYSIAIAAILGCLLVFFVDIPLLVYPIFIVAAFALLGLAILPWKVRNELLANYLDTNFPELEESASLLWKDDDHLLVQLQRAKVVRLLPQVHWPKHLLKQTRYALLSMIASIFLLLFLQVQRSMMPNDVRVIQVNAASVAEKLVKVPPQIAEVTVTIQPPSYTGLMKRTQKTFGIKAADGARVSWQIRTNQRVKQMKILFNDQELLVVNASDKSGTFWEFSRIVNHSGFYQLLIDGMKSDLYELEVLADVPVKIKVIRPKQSTVIDYGQVAMLNLQVLLEDEYGIRDAAIAATLASGKGEGVKFSEQNIRFGKSIGGQKQMNLSHRLDLRALGMKPGDELYFFVKAVDSRNQSSRSDVFSVSIVDTAELMSMNGMVSGVNLVPEYFRSQRQIIIDTEKLIREKGTVSLNEFKSRSNNLGLDQKLLRLRYGQFLGEESESEIGPNDEHDHDEPSEHLSNEEQTKALMNSFSHLHDIAEDATFFEPELKAQLKTVLTEMWKAELQLRTFKLQDALPFEYKALRLLKDLQQKSRAYVAKTTVKVPQLKEEKRLSGELDKILAPIQHNNFTTLRGRELMFKKALGALEMYKSGAPLNEKDFGMLKDLEKEMIVSASSYPSVYLPALKELRTLHSTGALKNSSIALLTRAILTMMRKESALPVQTEASPASTLYQRYFQHLNKLKS